MHKPAALALALVVLATLPAAAETYLLGGVLAEDVLDNEETGLIDIVSIQSSIYGVEVPYVADLWVYLRWEGEGAHDLDLYLLDPDGDVVADVADTLEFGDYATNFTTHSLANTVFAEEGTYVVTVCLDGEEIYDLPYCVNDDSGAPEYPYLLMSVPAVDGWGDELGWGEVEGAFEHYTFERFPGADDFAIVTLWFSGDDIYEQRLEIAGPDGTVVARSEAQEVDAWFGELTVVTDYFDNFLFKIPGDYLVTVYLDDEVQVNYTLRATLRE